MRNPTLSTLGVVVFGGAELSREIRLGRAAPSGAVRVDADEGAESKEVCRDRVALPRGDKFWIDRARVNVEPPSGAPLSFDTDRDVFGFFSRF